MENNQTQKENTEAIFKLILTENENLLFEIRKQFFNLSKIQLHIALLLKLGYAYEEIEIILSCPDAKINEIHELLKRTDS